MIFNLLIFTCGMWTGVILGLFLAGAMMLSKRADEAAERHQMDYEDPRITRIYQGNRRTEI